MDFASALKPDVYRTVSVILGPGLVASLPWMTLVFWPELQASQTWNKGSGVAAASLLLLVAFIAGQLLEDLGTRIESDWIDRRAKKQPQTKDILEVFWAYLKTPCEPVIVAQRFLSDSLTRYKIELSMTPALLLFAIGVLCGECHGTGLGIAKTAALALLAVSLGVWLLFVELPDSARLLHDIRNSIVEHFDPEGTDAEVSEEKPS